MMMTTLHHVARRPWRHCGRTARVGLAALLATALAGCATGLHPRMPGMDLPGAYDAAGPAALQPADLDAWWKGYGDAQLDALVARALSQGLDARLAMARLDEARAVRGQALSAYAPQGQVRGSAEATQSHNLGDGPDPALTRSQSLSLPISWEIDLFGRRAAARSGADADLAAAKFSHEASRAALAAQVAQTLFEARGLAAQLDDARENERIQSSLAALLDRRVARGLSAAADADRLGAEVARSQAQRMALAAELHAARRALLVLTGDGLAPVDSLDVSGALGLPPGLPAAMPGDLLRRRPDVREAAARIDSAAAAVRLAELDFFPTLTLLPTVGLSRQRGPVDASTSFWTLGAGLTVPLLDRPRLQAALDMQGARGQQAVLRYEAAVQTAFAEADQSLARLDAAAQRVQTLQAGAARARRAFDAAEIRYRRGLGDLQGLLDAEAAWRATRTALTAAMLDRLVRSVETFKALGGGWAASDTSLAPRRSSS